VHKLRHCIDAGSLSRTHHHTQSAEAVGARGRGFESPDELETGPYKIGNSIAGSTDRAQALNQAGRQASCECASCTNRHSPPKLGTIVY